MIRLIISYLLAALAGIFLQATVIHGTFPDAPVPDVLLVLVVLLALTQRSVPRLFGAFALGLLSDFASGQFLGPNAAGSVVAFGLVAVLASRVFAERVLAVLLMTFFCSLGKSLTIALLFTMHLDSPFLPGESVKLIFFEALLSALIAPLLLRLLSSNKRSGSSSRVTGTGSFRWSHEMK